MIDLVAAALVNGFLVSVPLAAVVWIAMRFSRRWLNAATRYFVWWMVLLAVTLAPLIYLPSSSRNAPSAAISSTSAEVRTASRAVTSAAYLAPKASVRRGTFAAVNLDLFLPSQWFVRIWITAAAMLSFRLLISLLLVQRRISQGAEPGPQLAAVLQSCLERAGVRRRVRCLIVQSSAPPMVAGPFRAAILLPAHLPDAVDNLEMEHVGLHEAAHLARFDDCALLLQRVMQAALALNPVVHWISRQIDLEREIACDDFVIALTGAPRDYASCLTHVAELTAACGSPTAAAATDERSHLSTRIEMLLDKSRCSARRFLTVRFAFAAAAVCLLSFASTRTPGLVAFAAAAQAPLNAPAAPATKRLFVTVTDPGKRFVTGLDKGVFHVMEGGVERRISGFDEADGQASLWIVWNVRGGPDAQLSMLRIMLAKMEKTYTATYPGIIDLQRKIEIVRQRGTRLPSGEALRDDMASKNPQDRFFLIATNAASLRDAVTEAGQSASPRRAIAIVSSSDAQDDLLLAGGEFANAVSEARLPVYPVRYGEFALADLTRITVEMRNQYVIDYQPGQAGRPTPTVRLNQPAGLPSLTPHVRR